MKNFTKMITVNTNYKAIGYATNMPIETYSGSMDYEFILECEEELSNEIEQQIQDFVENFTNCNHCGTRMRHVIIVKNLDTNTIHVIGRTCGENVRMFGKISERLNNQTIKAAKIAKGIKDMKNIFDANEGLEIALKSNNKIVISINDNFKKYKTISQKQIELVFKLAEKQKQFDVLKLDIVPINFTKLSNTTLEVVSTKLTENDYGVVTKVLLKSKEGWKIYGNLPSAISNIENGTNVVFSSNDISIGNDNTFGFFKRGKFILS